MAPTRLSTRDLLRLDHSRVRSLQTRLSSPSNPVTAGAATTIPAKLGTAVGTLNYVVTVGLGTPSRLLTVAFDTGSDLTWTQCRPCTGGCYTQSDPIFDPAASSTYRNFSCFSPDCAALRSGTGQPTSCTAPSTCVYSTSYGDGSFSSGFYASDTLTLPSAELPDFRFGCGVDNDGLFGSTAGLLGLGRDDVSIVSQSARKFAKVFSYCLPSSSSSSSGFLSLGFDSGSVSGLKYTPLLTNSDAPSFYYLELVGILVGGKKLLIPETAFSAPGTIIDSGTIISRLPPAAYSALRAAFREQMAAYKQTKGYEIFDTCYDFRGSGDVSIPKVVLRFGGGVDVDVDLSGILFAVKESQVCLAFAGNNDAGDIVIIGNQQQQTYEIVYDVAGERIGFAAGGCD